MKAFLILVMLSSVGNIWAQKIPNLLCQTQFTLHINPITFAVRRVEPSSAQGIDVYRIENDELYISSLDKNEYRYNKLNEAEKFRFYGGHKTILFERDYKYAISTHTYDDDIRVLKLKCSVKSK